MENKDTIAFIVEGEAREPLIIQNILNIHFKHSNFQIITLPAGKIFILSAFPEFLLDYFKQDFWNKTVQFASLRPYCCQKDEVNNVRSPLATNK